MHLDLHAPRHAARLGAGLLAAALGVAAACEGGNLFEAPGGVVTGDRAAPNVAIQLPVDGATIPLEDSILVIVRLTDDVGVRKVSMQGVAFRGDRDLGTLVAVTRFQSKDVALAAAVKDTVLRRYLIPAPDSVSERVSVIVMAEDSVGNATADTLSILVGGPRVEIVNPPSGQALKAGGTVGVRVRAADPQGKIAKVELAYSGVASGRIAWTFAPAQDTIVKDTTITLPTGAIGSLVLAATATSGAGVLSRPDSARFAVSASAAGDSVAPSVGISLSTADRLELTDRIRIAVSARDNVGGSGVRRIGATVLAVNQASPEDTLVLPLDTTFSAPRTGSANVTFSFPASRLNVDSLALPDSVTLLVHAFAVDDAQRCGAAVTTAEQRLQCVATSGGATIALGAAGQLANTIVVRGRTVLLPSGGVISDAAVDTTGQRLFLSNFSKNKVDVLDLQSMRFQGNGVLVGSEPWGLVFNNRDDTLMVANSGGTNISFIPVRTGTLAEDRARRLHTPDLLLITVTEKETPTGITLEVVPFGFSDRPQFLAQDSRGNLLFSTKPTSAAELGTIRLANMDPAPGVEGDTAETYILFPAGAVKSADKAVSFAHADGADLIEDSLGGVSIRIYDHVPGFPGRKIAGTGRTVAEAISQLRAAGSDVSDALIGTWDIDAIGLSDTTFVAASGDRRRVAFGEGATAPFARIFMWDAEQRSFSSVIQVEDLIHNAAERVNGLGLNHDGSLGVARGGQAAYFFTPDLRLEGQFALAPGAAGGAMHPDHGSLDQVLPQGVAFVGTSRNTIQIIDTFHFFGLRELHIRSSVVGPLKASPPLASDNNGQGRNCNGSDCVVMKLFGVTADGGVVVVDVRGRDLEPVSASGG